VKDQVAKLLIPRDQKLQLIGWDDKDGTGFGDLPRGEQAFSCEDAQLSCEFTRTASGQLPLGPCLMIRYGDLAGQDHDEVVAVTALSEQDLSALSCSDLSVLAQKFQLGIAQMGSQNRIGRQESRLVPGHGNVSG
jgi:hypothetical protein